MNAVNESKVCLLATVYRPYRWLARITADLIERHWPEHPPMFFCGLEEAEADGLPVLPLRRSGPERVWAEFALDAARELADRGFELCYFLLEDQPPLARCHAGHLAKTLPGLMNSLPASYIGLMGWDNRRFNYPSPILPRSRFRLMHHRGPRTPRFHLHPSLFRMETLIRCLELTARGGRPNPWGFEKTCDQEDAPLPEEDKAGCYQICGEELSLRPPGALRRTLRDVERAFYRRAMSLHPPLDRVGLGKTFWDGLGFDDVFFDGPYPMFYAGIMARGGLNPRAVRFLAKHDPNLLLRIREAAAAAEAQTPGPSATS